MPAFVTMLSETEMTHRKIEETGLISSESGPFG